METSTGNQEVSTTETTAKLSQKDAVYVYVTDVVGLPKDGVKLRELLTKDVKKVVRQRLFAAVRSGEVKLSKQRDDSGLKKYCSGLINNWMNKDPRFN